LVTGAADDDPSGIATYSQAGAQFGYGLLWTVFLTTSFMIAIQLVSAHIGRVTGKGIVANTKEFYPSPLVLGQQVLIGMFFPRISLNSDYLLLAIAVFGTTISPYLFLLAGFARGRGNASYPFAKPLKELSRGGDPELRRMAIDTAVGMSYSNIIAYFIVLTAAATLYAHGVTEIKTYADAAEALRPIVGEFTFFLLALGIIDTGLLAIPVLAGSAAYGVAEAFGWRATLAAEFPEAVGF
jgi:Mn2+/Fe2+ NRAMP family transporter